MASYTLQGFTNDASSADLDATNLNEMDNAIKIGHDFADSASSSPSAGKAMVWPENASGTFTPKIAFGGSSVGVVHTTQNAYYQKVGAAVSFTIYIAISTKGGLAGDISVTGLPFVANTFFAPVTVGYYYGITTTGKLTGYANQNTDVIYLTSSLDNGTIEVVTAGMCSENTWFMLAGTYFTSQ